MVPEIDPLIKLADWKIYIKLTPGGEQRNANVRDMKILKEILKNQTLEILTAFSFILRKKCVLK